MDNPTPDIKSKSNGSSCPSSDEKVVVNEINVSNTFEVSATAVAAEVKVDTMVVDDNSRKEVLTSLEVDPTSKESNNIDSSSNDVEGNDMDGNADMDNLNLQEDNHPNHDDAYIKVEANDKTQDESPLPNNVQENVDNRNSNSLNEEYDDDMEFGDFSSNGPPTPSAIETSNNNDVATETTLTSQNKDATSVDNNKIQEIIKNMVANSDSADDIIQTVSSVFNTTNHYMEHNNSINIVNKTTTQTTNPNLGDDDGIFTLKLILKRRIQPLTKKNFDLLVLRAIGLTAFDVSENLKKSHDTLAINGSSGGGSSSSSSRNNSSGNISNGENVFTCEGTLLEVFETEMECEQEEIRIKNEISHRKSLQRHEDELLKAKLAMYDVILQEELDAIDYQNEIVVKEKEEAALHPELELNLNGDAENVAGGEDLWTLQMKKDGGLRASAQNTQDGDEDKVFKYSELPPPMSINNFFKGMGKKE